MPELPEVELAARSLRRWLGGRVVRGATAERTRIFRSSDPARFERDLPGKRLEGVERRGKVLLLRFSGGIGLLSHLGMTGKWVLRRGGPPPRHSRASLGLDGGEVLHYLDPRLFGKLSILPADRLGQAEEVRSLGPDPLIDGIDPDALHDWFRRTRRQVKVVLMDQRVLAGLGNIQATEALFLARLHPSRPASSLSREETARLVGAISDSIRETLEKEGASEELTYVEEPGGPNPFLVYGRTGQPCPRCGSTLESESIGGRTSVFCPRCQPT